VCVWWVGGAHQTALALRTDRCVEARVPRPTVAVGWRLLTERRRLAAEVGRACKRVLRARQRSIRRDRRQHGALQWGGGPSGSFRRQSLVLAEALRAATAVSAPAIKRVRAALWCAGLGLLLPFSQAAGVAQSHAAAPLWRLRDSAREARPPLRTGLLLLLLVARQCGGTQRLRRGAAA